MPIKKIVGMILVFFTPGLVSSSVIAVGNSVARETATALDVRQEFVVGTFAFARREKPSYVGLLVEKALAEYGYQLRIKHFPGKRLMAQLNTGDIDGDLGRTLNLTRAFENIVRVEEPLFRPCALLYRLASRPPLDINNVVSELRIGTISGGPGGNSLLTDRWPTADLVTFKSFQQAGQLLMNDRIDLVALPAAQRSVFLDTLERPVVLQGVFHLQPVYMHVHKRHDELAVRLAASIKLLKRQHPSRDCVREEF